MYQFKRSNDALATGALILGYLSSLTVAVAPTQASADSITLETKPPLMRGVAALPKAVAGAEPAALKKINGELARANASTRNDAKECLREKRSEWTRKVDVTMQGPRYLSFVARDSYFCGGAHPDERLSAYVFDLTTGAAPDWAKLLPGLDLHVESETMEGVTLRSITSGTLSKLYRDAAKIKNNDPECAKNLADFELTFNLWLEGKAKALGVAPSELPHAIAACAVDVTIPLSSLKPSDVGAELSEAVTGK